MALTRRAVLSGIGFMVALSTSAVAGQSDDGVKRLAIQVSDNDPGTFNKALNVATNFARSMSESGELYEIEIVTFNAGLHLLRTDTSPVMDRIQSISESIPEVSFSACGNTIAGMTRNEGAAPPITEYAQVVQAGVGRLLELDNLGYYVIRP